MSFNNDDFIVKVQQMRITQKEYFKTRDGMALTRARALEKEIDNMLLSISAPQKSLL